MRRAVWSSTLMVIICNIYLYPCPVRAASLQLDIDAAVERALVFNRDNVKKGRVALAQANLERSKALMPSNPFFSGGVQHTSQGSGPNFEFLLSQEFEVAGQRAKRVEIAAEGLERVTWETKSAEQNLIAAVKIAFMQAAVDADRVTVAHQNADFSGALIDQLDVHKLTSDMQRFDLNVAGMENTRARRQLAAAEQAHEQALATLRRLLGLPAEQELELAGAPEQHAKELPAAPELVARALEHRADLIALRHGVQRADRQLDLTKREAIPNLTVSGTVSRFEGDTLAGGDVGVPIPLFQRKTAETAEAIAEHDRASTDLHSLERDIPEDVIRARRACLSAFADLQAMQQDIVPKSQENLDLQRRSYERGDARVSELIAAHTDLITARRNYLDALQAYNETLIELERVTGEDLKLL